MCYHEVVVSQNSIQLSHHHVLYNKNWIIKLVPIVHPRQTCVTVWRLWMDQWVAWMEHGSRGMWGKWEEHGERIAADLPIQYDRIGRCFVSIATTFLFTTSTTHHFVCEEDTAHFGIFILAFICDWLKIEWKKCDRVSLVYWSDEWQVVKTSPVMGQNCGLTRCALLFNCYHYYY